VRIGDTVQQRAGEQGQQRQRYPETGQAQAALLESGKRRGALGQAIQDLFRALLQEMFLRHGALAVRGLPGRQLACAAARVPAVVLAQDRVAGVGGFDGAYQYDAPCYLFFHASPVLLDWQLHTRIVPQIRIPPRHWPHAPPRAYFNYVHTIDFT